MKNVLTGLVLMFSTVLTYGQQVVVQSDQDQNVDFSKYKTFTWAPQVISKTDNEMMFLNDLEFKATIMDAIGDEMEGRGYEPNENADLIVNFRVFDKPVRIKGVTGYGTGYFNAQSGQQYRSISDTTSYSVKAGTLLVSLIDKKMGKTVWNSFASGLLDGNQFIKDDVKIREAVNLIFNEYGQRAPGLTRR